MPLKSIYTLSLMLSCALFNQAAAQECSNWLRVGPFPSYAEAGEIDIAGTTLTVEARFNRTATYSGGPLWAGDLVSKHRDPIDVNYLLRPNSAEITTTNGYFKTPDICEIELNKTYHVAMVYDGTTLKFYRNGFLMSQISASGDLFQNNWKTRIGHYEAAIYLEHFIGYIDEVRIWNVVRTEAEIKTFMNASLPSPSSIPGLVAYYTFEDLANKQGNSTYNLTLSPNASINNANPQCSFIADSCNQLTMPPDSLVVTNDTALCYGESLTIQTIPGVRYTWTPELFMNNATSPTPVIKPEFDVVYYVEGYHSATNTTIKDSIHVVVNKPALTLSDDVTICSGTSTSLQAFTPNSIKWTPSASLSDANSTSPIARPSATTKYTATVTDVFGCSFSDDVIVSVLQTPPFTLTGESAVCEGARATITAGSGNKYTWTSDISLPDNRSASIVVTPAADANFSVLIEDTVCMRDTLMNWHLSVISTPELVITKSNDITCEVPTARLMVTGASTYNWITEQAVDSKTSFNPLVSIDSTTTIFVRGTSDEGCSAEASIVVNVNKGGVLRFDLPNVFTPNNDGKNDCFGIRNWGKVEVKQFAIYNRWGQQVFSGAENSSCWDGTVKGIKQPVGGYVYVINASSFCGEIRKMGHILLVR